MDIENEIFVMLLYVADQSNMRSFMCGMKNERKLNSRAFVRLAFNKIIEYIVLNNFKFRLKI